MGKNYTVRLRQPGHPETCAQGTKMPKTWRLGWMKMASEAHDGPTVPRHPQSCAQGHEMAQAGENNARRPRQMKREPGVAEMAKMGETGSAQGH
jgi:hypothetical protein